MAKPTTLASIVIPDSEVPPEFFISEEDLPKWEHMREAKREPRTTAAGFTYMYTEGAMAWPDPLDKPARTILTGEGGKALVAPSMQCVAIAGVFAALCRTSSI